MTPRLCLAMLLLACLLTPARAVADDVTYPPRIGDREFILDEADMIDEPDEQAIASLCDTLLTDKQIPIVVVTIPSLATYGAGDWRIERYAHNLFDEWGIGSEDYNYAILLLVAKGDRKARIELGADWGREHDDAARKIMDRLIIPSFKAGKFSEGIRSGVEGLDKMARGQDIPGSPIGDAARTVTNTTQSFGDKIAKLVRGLGANCLFLIALPAIILARLFGWGGRRGRGYYVGGGGFGGGGGFSGGSFGGGFSGGGGATGSW